MEIKPLHIQVTEDMWLFLKITSAEKKISMAEIIIQSVEKTYKKKFERKLTSKKTNV